MKTAPIDRAIAEGRGAIAEDRDAATVAARPRSHAAQLRAMGMTIGLLFVLFVAADYLFRPTFVSINVDSDETSRATPGMVTALHFFVQFAVAAPILRILQIDRVDLRRVYHYALVGGVVIVIAALSLLSHPDAKASINLLTVAWSFTLFGLLAASEYGRGDCIRHAFTVIAIGCGLLLYGVAFEAEYSWGRLAGRVGPNYWGMIAFVTFVTSFALPRWWHRVPLWAVIAFILAETSARGSLVALTLSAAVVYGAFVWHMPKRYRGWALLPGIALVILLPVLVPIVASDVLLLTDARRGVGSGGTGRSIAWGQAFALFKANPWLGVGFRQHRQYITIASSAHQAYLAALAEIGLPGLIAYLIYLFGAAAGAIRRMLVRPELHFAAITGFLVGFIFIGLVESVFLTLGSPLPFLLAWLAPQAWSADPLRRKRSARLSIFSRWTGRLRSSPLQLAIKQTGKPR